MVMKPSIGANLSLRRVRAYLVRHALFSHYAQAFCRVASSVALCSVYTQVLDGVRQREWWWRKKTDIDHQCENWRNDDTDFSGKRSRPKQPKNSQKLSDSQQSGWHCTILIQEWLFIVCAGTIALIWSILLIKHTHKTDTHERNWGLYSAIHSFGSEASEREYKLLRWEWLMSFYWVLIRPNLTIVVLYIALKEHNFDFISRVFVCLLLSFSINTTECKRCERKTRLFGIMCSWAVFCVYHFLIILALNLQWT